ncbi:monothiol glutaredoxin-4 [Pyrenophora seminiperda CCB06]|uniref:Monothiol glutaredoxin-4 n=1 Tax=Pyrenophora seminiperda CCB06 TaxID=1302712 RepID=A0A3M7LXN8_9PLEO|nr:monothiol glutaredoxin-4 [Pyrenophora seminiperda CCB06]
MVGGGETIDRSGRWVHPGKLRVSSDGAMATMQEMPDESAFQSTISALPASTLAVIYFHAPWAKPCEQMSIILKTLASTYSASAPICFLSLNAEELPEVSEAYDVTAVPYIVLQKDGKTLETVSGSDASKVRAAVEKYAGAGSGQSSSLPPPQTVTRPQENGTDSTAKNLAGYVPDATDPKTAPDYSAGQDAQGEQQTTSKEELHQRLGELVKAAPVMLFMKGTPSAPQCGFSRQTVVILREKGIRYGFFNILADDEVRQGLKEFADWPTFPQLWADGELVGGLDIVREEFENDPEFLSQYAANAGKTAA